MAVSGIRIGVVAPARSLDRQVAERVSALTAGMADIVFHPQCFLQEGHFAGSDAERASALIEFANDPGLDAIWFARGGYGSGRLLGLLTGRLGPAARRKTWLGYSDTGCLLAFLAREGIGRVVHGPMPADILRPDGERAVLRSAAFLAGHDPEEQLEPSTRGPGCYAAFNISVLASLVGTCWAPDLAGHTLLLEDVDEHLYRLDRLFFTLTSSPTVRSVRGIRLGRCGPVPQNDIPFGASEEDIARDWCARSGIAYLGRADIGHDARNRLVVFGPRS